MIFSFPLGESQFIGSIVDRLTLKSIQHSFWLGVSPDWRMPIDESPLYSISEKKCRSFSVSGCWRGINFFLEYLLAQIQQLLADGGVINLRLLLNDVDHVWHIPPKPVHKVSRQFLELGGERGCHFRQVCSISTTPPLELRIYDICCLLIRIHYSHPFLFYSDESCSFVQLDLQHTPQQESKEQLHISENRA